MCWEPWFSIGPNTWNIAINVDLYIKLVTIIQGFFAGGGQESTNRNFSRDVKGCVDGQPTPLTLGFHPNITYISSPPLI